MRQTGAAVVLLLIIAFGIWARFAAPCSFWGHAPIHDVPARCTTVMRR